MNPRRLLVVGAVSTAIMLAAAWLWHEFTRIHTVAITVPDGDGFFAVWSRDAHADVVEVDAGVATFSFPRGRLLRTKSMSFLEGWHHERYVDRGGELVDDVRGLGAMVSSEWDGVVHWWYRGPESDVMRSSKAQEAWLRERGVAR